VNISHAHLLPPILDREGPRIHHLRLLVTDRYIDNVRSQAVAQLVLKTSGVLRSFSCPRTSFIQACWMPSDGAGEDWIAAFAACSRLTELDLTLPSWKRFGVLAGFSHLNTLRTSLPSWNDLDALTPLVGLRVLCIDTTVTPASDVAPVAVTLGQVTRLEWRHYDPLALCAGEHMRCLSTFVLPALQAFLVEWNPMANVYADRKDNYAVAAHGLASSFSRTSPDLYMYSVTGVFWGSQTIFTMHMPQSVRHLCLDGDLLRSFTVSEIQRSVTEVTLTTHHVGTVAFVKSLCVAEADPDIVLVRIDPAYTIKNPRALSRELRTSAVFSPWTWAGASSPGTDGKTLAQSHADLHADLQQFAPALKQRGITVMDVQGALMDH
jgi:hypothetical protein